MFCKHCGAEMDENSRFCASCGKRIEKVIVLKNTDNTPASAWPESGEESEAEAVKTTPVAVAEPPVKETESAPEHTSQASTMANMQQNVPYPPYPPVYPPYFAPVQKDRSCYAVASLVLGILGVFAWLLPLVGFPITIIGLILGVAGRNSHSRGMAVAGIVLSIIFLVLTIGNSALGILMFLDGFGNYFY